MTLVTFRERKWRFEAVTSALILFVVTSLAVARQERVLTSYDLARPLGTATPSLILEGLEAPVSFLAISGIVSGTLPAEADGAWLGSGDVRIAFFADEAEDGILVLEMYAPSWHVQSPVVTAVDTAGAVVASVAVDPGEPAMLLIELANIFSNSVSDFSFFDLTLTCFSDEGEGSFSAPVLCAKLVGVKFERPSLAA